MNESPLPPESGAGLNGFGPSRRSTVRFVLSIAVALAAAFALYLFQPGWFSAPAAAVPQTGPTPTPTPTPRPQPPHFPYLGQPRHFDKYILTPLSVRYTRGSDGNVANQGDVFVVVMLQYRNTSNGDLTLVPTVNCGLPYCNFYVLDSQGEKNPPIRYDPYHTGLRPVVLQANGYQEGSYTFEVPERDVGKTHALQLLFYPDPLTDANNVKHWYLEYAPKHGR